MQVAPTSVLASVIRALGKSRPHRALGIAKVGCRRLVAMLLVTELVEPGVSSIKLGLLLVTWTLC